MPTRQQRAQHNGDDHGDSKGLWRKRRRRPARRNQPHHADQHQHRRCRQRATHGELNRASRERGDDAGADPAARHAAGNQDRHLRGIYLDHRDEDERLRDHRQRMPDEQRARNEFIRHPTHQPERRRGRGEGADAERVEEVGDEADQRVQRGRPAMPLASLFRRPEPTCDEQQAAHDQCAEQDLDDGHDGV